MANDGYAALMNEVDKAKPGGPRLLSFDAMPADPDDMTGLALGIKYRDSGGRVSHRWVTVRTVDADNENTLVAYCWKRRTVRTFRLDRIAEAVDGDGEVIDGGEFIERLGGEPPSAPETVAEAPVSERQPGRYATPAPPTGRRLTRKERREKARKEAVHRVAVDAAMKRQTVEQGPATPNDGKRGASVRSPLRWVFLGVLGSLALVFAAGAGSAEGQKALAGFLLSAATLAFVVGLVKPALVLPWVEAPTRKGAAVASVAALLVILVLGLVLVPS